ncbi:MAG: Fe-S-containing hydro-lyase [Firmicutes bacterium]|nr:Fe-S-containing hydro-lyase [Bacillota bacterium]
MEATKLKTPLTREQTAKLEAGQSCLLSGTIYTARDAAHKRLVELLDNGQSLPVDLAGQVIYYVGPCPAPPGKVIGSAGPTTSMRMDSYTPAILKAGVRAVIGKGDRGPEVVEALKEQGAVYLGAIGGAGALIARHIRKAEVVAFPDLGPEAIHRLEVEDLPVIVLIDSAGNNFYRIGRNNFTSRQ